MLSILSRRLVLGVTLFCTFFLIGSQAQAGKPKPKPKAVSMTATIKSLDVKRNSASLRYGVKTRVKVKVRGHRKPVYRYRTVYRVAQAQITRTARILGGDRSGDGIISSKDLRRGDRVSVRGKLNGNRLTVSALTNASSLPHGDRNGDTIPDDVDHTDLLATLLSVNQEQHLMTLQVTAAPGQRNLAGQQITVAMSDGALLSLGDTNGDGVRDWRDIRVDDQFALSLIAPVDPANAQALLAVDLTSLGIKAPDRKHRMRAIPMGGVITALDSQANTVTIQPSLAGVELPEFTIHVDGNTQFEIDDTNGDSAKNLGDLQAGDRIKVLVAMPADPNNLLAVKIIKKAPHHQSHHSARLSGQILALDQENQTFDLAVEEGPQAGQTVTVSWNSNSNLEVDDTNGDGVSDWQDVQVGDQFSVVVDDMQSPLALLAADHGPGDNGGEDNGGDNPPPPPAVLVGTLNSVDRQARTVSIDVHGGALDGQTVVVHFTWRTRPATQDNNHDGEYNWDDLQAGDNIGAIVDNTNDLNAWAILDTGDDPLPSDFGQEAGAGGEQDTVAPYLEH